MRNRTFGRWGLVLPALVGFSMGAARAESGFSLKDQAGKHLDILFNGRIVARYMYEYDPSTKQSRARTYKPFLHVFDGQGRWPITKGAGGLYTHHRGIFIGWSRIGFEGQRYDRWHNKDGEQAHQKFTVQKASRTGATVTSIVHWNDRKKQPILEEERTFFFHTPPRGAHFLLDVTSVIKATKGDLDLNGDPEHAGIQFRPANEVDKSVTTYVFPREDANPRKHTDFPWVGETFGLKGEKFSAVIINHPDNPKKTKFSAYRDYGRFGAFPTAKIKKGGSRAFQYRFLVADGEMLSAKLIQTVANQFTGRNDPTPGTKVVNARGKGKKRK